MTRYLTQLDGMSFTRKHLFWLDEICKLDYDKEDPKDLIRLAAEGKLQFWDFNNQQGLLFTQVQSSVKRKSLIVYGFIGSGLFTKAQSIMKELEDYAKSFGCTRIEGYSQIEDHEMIYTRLAMTAVATRFVKEI